jgi:hypothetical protein
LLLMTVRQGLEKRRLSLENKRLEQIEAQAQALAHAKEEMERLDQLKNTFLITISHELRSPVGAALSLLRSLTRGMAGKLAPQQQDLLDRIELRLNELSALIDDLLALTVVKTFEARKPLPIVDLRTPLAAAIERFRAEAQAGQVALRHTPGSDPFWLHASREGLDKIVGNLIGNAIKYTPQGGWVEVAADCQQAEIVLSVCDSGIGIPQEDLARLGEEFFRASNARRSGIVGTGLGMSIVQHSLNQFGGRMQVRSQLGQGTTVEIRFPSAAPPDPARVHPAATRIPKGGD